MIHLLSGICIGIALTITWFLGITWLSHACGHRLVLGNTEDDYIRAYEGLDLWEVLASVKLFRKDHNNE